jgi:transposase
MSLKETGEITGLNWKTLKEIDRDYIKSLLPNISELKFSRIAIDEIAIAKGHKYVSIIRDYDTGVVIKIVPSRKYESVKAGLLSLGTPKLDNIKIVCLDMWEAYIKAINEIIPHAKLVFDKFHIVKKVNEAVDKVRKEEFAKADKEERLLMKRKRFIILSKGKNLDNKEKEELSILMKKNERLYKAYLLKEQIISIFDDKKSSHEQIEKRFLAWMENILNENFEEFYQIVDMIRQFFYGIMNYFRYGMTNAISEGFNTKINVIKRRAFGFRDVEYFMLKIIQNSLKRFA